jgi:phosphoketolase
MKTKTLSPDLLRKLDAWWRAANYPSVGQIYLYDNPDLLVACVVGDGEAETGPLATSWHSNKFLNPNHDGAVLPILQH